jgi:predicted RNase H-like nuclease
MFLTRSEVSMQGARLAGVDLAWHGVKPSGFALGRLHNNTLYVDHLVSEVLTNDELCRTIKEYNAVGVAIDAPLIINNQTGMRDCERQIGVLYGNKGASCHTANLTLFPNATSVLLSEQLQQLHYEHIVGTRWQIEVYPHPAIIELFNLDYRLAYKKGKVAERKAGQLLLANYLKSLGEQLPFTLRLDDDLPVALTEAAINDFRGEQLKQNEDKLDAIICLVIAVLHHLNQTIVVGAEQDGYIVLPSITQSNKTSTDDDQLALELFNLLSPSQDELMKSRGQIYPECSAAERDTAFKNHVKLKKAFDRKVASLEAPAKSKVEQSPIIKSCASLLCRAFLDEYPEGTLTRTAKSDYSLYQYAQTILSLNSGVLEYMDREIEIINVIPNESIEMGFIADEEAKIIKHSALKKALDRSKNKSKDILANK